MTPQPSNTPHLHDLLSARQFPSLADRNAGVDAPTVTVTPVDVTSPPLPTEKSYVPEFEHPQEDMNAPRVRKAGRPRLDAGAVLSEDRRKQVRRAQRTYRLKKEATLQQTKQRVVDLENRLNRVSSSFAEMMQTLDPSVRSTSPALSRRLDAIYALLADGEDGGMNSRGGSESGNSVCDAPVPEAQSPRPSPGQGADIHRPASASASASTSSLDPNHQNPPSHPFFPNPLHPPKSTSTHSYSHHEKTLTRLLHRRSLEHAFALYNDPRTHPLQIYQVFRLVPCIQDKCKMDPYFRRLVSATVDEHLELHTLPFYCIGGAGTHFPALDAQGRPVFPVNRRLPRRVLGVLPVDLGMGMGSGSGSGGAWRRREGGREEERRLQAYGLGGVWFDCRDVEGYLREMGVRLDEGLFPEVTMGESPREENDCDAAEQLQASLLDSVMSTGGKDVDEPSLSSKVCRRILDIDSFLSKLLQGLVILGRAPGFRRSDVVSAFHSALLPGKSV